MHATGCLLLWNDCAPGHEAAYESWYREEHLPERMAVAGFVCGVRHRALDGLAPAFMTYYEVTHPEVLHSSSYRALLAQPTPRTRHIMQVAFKNMNRTVCALQLVRTGALTPYAVTATGNVAWLDALVPPPQATRVLALRGLPKAETTAEEALRGGDASVEAAVVAHVENADQALALAQAMGGRAWQQVAYATGTHAIQAKA